MYKDSRAHHGLSNSLKILFFLSWASSEPCHGRELLSTNQDDGFRNSRKCISFVQKRVNGNFFVTPFLLLFLHYLYDAIAEFWRSKLLVWKKWHKMLPWVGFRPDVWKLVFMSFCALDSEWHAKVGARSSRRKSNCALDVFWEDRICTNHES